MGLLSAIAVATLAIGGYKYFKEEDFKEKVNENVKKGYETIRDTAAKVTENAKQKYEDYKEKKQSEKDNSQE